MKEIRGRDESTYIAALRQAKIYPPRQAAAAADSALWLPQSTRNDPHCRNLRAAIHKIPNVLMDCGLWIAAAVIHDIHLVDCGSRKRH